MMSNPSLKPIRTKSVPFSYPIISRELLERPTSFTDRTFIDAVLGRKSSRSFARISVDQLSTLLYLSCKTLAVNTDFEGNEWQHRPVPSAGGLHPIDLVVGVPQKKGYTLNYYNPICHSLDRLKLNPEVSRSFVAQINGVVPTNNVAVILWMIAHPSRTSAKYASSLSLVWRDAGCLLYCISLVSSALGIKCCPVGSLGEPFVSRLLKPYGKVFGVGGCLVG